ncbi:MAG: tetratricopeptide repeat protein [Bacteroidetes bacterium]|nr:tetratricopeptide repeat protein [Bacteroidota bacterium]
MKHTILIFCIALLAAAPLAGQTAFRSPLPEAAKGDRLFSQEKYKEALGEYKKLPASAESRKRLGAVYIKLWNMSEAIAALRDAVNRAPHDSEAGTLLAEALSWDGKLREALDIYRGLLGKGEDTAELRLGYARTLSWNKDVNGALEQYRLATRGYPRNLDAHMGLAEMLSWKKRFDQSIAAYRRVLDLTDVSAYKSVALTRIAKVLTWKGDMDAAEAHYRQAIHADGTNVDALFGLGELNEWSGEYREAKSWYQKILQVQPDHKGAKAKLLQLMWVK